MAKTKKITEPHYELLYIISNKFTEDEVKPIAAKIESIITANEGKITYREDWGKKKLAYPIQHFAFGYYLLVEFDVEPVTLAKIERSIRMMHEVIRHQIVVRTVRTIDLKEKPKALFVDEPKKDKVAEPAVKTDVATEVKAPEVEIVAKSEVKEEVVEEIKETAEAAPKKTKATKESKASIEELDAKLDKILDTSDLI